MKNRMQRLTALLLALMMIFGMLAASAESVAPGSMTLDKWNELVDNAMQKLFDIHEGGSGKTITPPTEQLPSNPNAPYQNSNGYYLSQGRVSMSTSDSVTVTSSTAGQWQIQVGTMWVNLAGETGNTLTVTYAMLANTNSVAYSVRQVDADGSVIGTMVFDVTEATPAERPQVATLSTETRGDDGIMTLEDTNTGDSSNVKKTYSILVEYQFEDGKQAADSYTGTIAEGSDFSATVTFPTVVGYLPYLGTDTESTTSLSINISSMSEDVKYTVTYKPTLVNYTVIHYQQNVNDDGYTIKETETKQGLTASQVDEVAHVYTKTVDNVTTTYYKPDTSENRAAYEGFYSLLYERPDIAADGSTVIEVYYDRYYYLVNFDMDGGYGTDPVYARYGADIGTVENPTKAGYTFKGWATTKGETSADKAVKLPETMPAENKTYYAIWEVGESAKVTVVFWGENADDEEYSYLADKTKVINLKPGISFTYSENEMLVCAKEVHTHSDDCLDCGKEEHTHTAVDGSCYTLNSEKCSHTAHTIACYSVASANWYTTSLVETNKPTNELTDKGNGIYTYTQRRDTYYYLNIGDKWYCGHKKGNEPGSESDDATLQITFSCSHTHNADCYDLICTREEHTHNASCYACGKEAHSHNSDCYMQGAGLDGKLWEFDHSETITVKADGSSVVNVYYKRVEYTITFKDGNSTVKTLKEKWGADISTHWPVVGTNGKTYDSGQRWTPSGSTTYTNVLVYLSIMPSESFTLTVSVVNYDTYHMHYMVEALPGAENTTSYNGVTYVERFSVTANYNYVTKNEDFFDLKGFTQKESSPEFKNNQIDINNGGNVNFYYTRNSYTLTFNDQYNDVKKESVKFEAPLSTYKDYVPEVPSQYEAGSVVFGGWYQNPQCTGEQYKLEEHTMPSHDIILYAKWVPVTHKVKFYLTENSTDIYTPATATEAATWDVPHGGNIAEEYVKNHLEKAAMNEAKPNGDYTFVMWYYYNEAHEKIPFDPTTQIRKDLTLYGEWSSNTLKSYTVQYVLAEKTDSGIVVQKDADGNPIKVADDLTGSGLAGTTKTFDAKGDTELYAAYQEGYFPTVQSQSLLLDIDKKEDELVIVFKYVPVEAVPYTVRYVTEETVAESTTIYGTVTIGGKTYTKLAEDKKEENNRKAVVTETFKPISGYMPDAYQKRLVVTADGENVLYFYYSKDETHAYYKITHYTQNTDGETWTEYASSQAVGNIGERYTASEMTIPGFTFDHIEYVVNKKTVPEEELTDEGAALTADGLEINLYYVRNKYPYKVRYLEQGSNNELYAAYDDKAMYGTVVSGYDHQQTIDGYDCVAVNPESGTINIRIDAGDEDGKATINIITFYYKEKEVTINYVPVGPEGATDFGSVDPTTETVKVMSGTANGSTPTAGDGFKFVGWYKDADCTQSVADDWVTDNKIVPKKTDGKNVAATYYAKFEWDVSTLTITKNGMKDGDSAIFKVTVGETVYRVVLNDKQKSVTLANLKVGATYTIEEDDTWSNRYNVTKPDNASGTIAPPSNPVTVEFTNTKTTDQWLHDETGVINNFGTGNKTEIK